MFMQSAKQTSYAMRLQSYTTLGYMDVVSM